MSQSKEELQAKLDELIRMKVNAVSTLSGASNREFDRMSELADDLDEKIALVRKEIDEIKEQNNSDGLFIKVNL